MFSEYRNLVLCTLGAVLTHAVEAVQAQPAPSMEWEIVNRFAPFETQDDPAGLFATYALRAGESFEQWHERLAQQDGGMVSPYRDALMSRDRDAMHWDQSKNGHQSELLDFVRKEDDPETTVDIRVRIDVDGECNWGQSVEDLVPCRNWHNISVPLAGADVTVSGPDFVTSETLKPRHIVIVALGDSYGSGEGNPDYPAKWKSDPQISRETSYKWLKDSNRLVPVGSGTRHWVDDRCHRSFFSHQSLTALRIASEDPQVFVSFLHYACTGAEIFDGVLVPQYREFRGSEYVPYSQVNLAIRELCKSDADDLDYVAVTEAETANIDITRFHRRGGSDNLKRSTASDLMPGDAFSKDVRTLRKINKITKVAKINGGNYPESGFLNCAAENLRTPDYVFLSIGGNDIGFAELVRYFAAPVYGKLRPWLLYLDPDYFLQSLAPGASNEDSVYSDVLSMLYPDVCPDEANRAGPTDEFEDVTRYCEKQTGKIGYDAADLIRNMPDKYRLLFSILRNRLGVEPSQIVMPQYPDALRYKKPNGTDICPDVWSVHEKRVHGTEPRENDRQSAWNGLKVAVPEWNNVENFAYSETVENWQFNLTCDEAFVVLRQFDAFRDVLARTAVESRITFVTETRDAFVGYGWWEGRRLHLPHVPDASELPTISDDETDDTSWDPAKWDPYAFEGPTEGEETTRAIRTGNDSVLTQPWGNRAVTGSVHPNLTGHRLIAEKVYNHLPVW